MNYRLLGKSGLRVSEFPLGTMTFGEEWGWGTAKDEARTIYSAYPEAGGKLHRHSERVHDGHQRDFRRRIRERPPRANGDRNQVHERGAESSDRSAWRM